MIQSRWRFLGRQKIFIQLFFFAVVTILLADIIARSFFEFGILYKFQKGTHPATFDGVYIIGFMLWLYNISSIVRFINITTIDINNKTISFKNILTRKVKTYSFSYFDGYYSTSRTAGGGYRYRELFLMKNNRPLRKISEYYYSNFESLAEAIGSLHYIGPFKYSFQNDVRMFFNMSF